MSEPIGLINLDDSKHRVPRGPASPTGGVEGVERSGSGPVASVRPFTGFDRERSTYSRLKPDLLARARGQFVVIVGDDCEGPLPTFGDAERAGYRRFGFGPLYIKQVLDEEPAQEVSRDIRACRT